MALVFFLAGEASQAPNRDVLLICVFVDPNLFEVLEQGCFFFWDYSSDTSSSFINSASVVLNTKKKTHKF